MATKTTAQAKKTYSSPKASNQVARPIGKTTGYEKMASPTPRVTISEEVSTLNYNLNSLRSSIAELATAISHVLAGEGDAAKDDSLSRAFAQETSLGQTIEAFSRETCDLNVQVQSLTRRVCL